MGNHQPTPARRVSIGTGSTKASVRATMVAANHLSKMLLAAELAGWTVAMSYRGLCWLGKAGGAWTATVSVRAHPESDNEKAVVVTVSAVGSRWTGALTIPEPPTQGPGVGAGIARKLQKAFAELRGPMVVPHAPGHCIVASSVVRCIAAQADGKPLLVVLLEREVEVAAATCPEPLDRKTE